METPHGLPCGRTRAIQYYLLYVDTRCNAIVRRLSESDASEVMVTGHALWLIGTNIAMKIYRHMLP